MIAGKPLAGRGFVLSDRSSGTLVLATFLLCYSQHEASILRIITCSKMDAENSSLTFKEPSFHWSL